MFKKTISKKTKTPLRSSDCRKLKTEIINQYPNLNENEKFESIFNIKNSEISQAKFQTPNGNGFIYYIKNQPMLIKLGKDLIPTVYMLWELPNMIKTIKTYKPVVDKVMSGADLMLPGVIRNSIYSGFNENDVVSISIEGAEEYPMAVGYTNVSAETINEMNPLKGKCVEVIHSFKDVLWKEGSKFVPEIKIENYVATSNTVKDIEEDKGSINDESNQDQNEEAHNDETQNKEYTDIQNEENDKKENIDENDEKFKKAFFQAICYKLNDNSLLPLQSSTLFSSYIISCFPPGEEINIKKTSFKKLSKFLKSMEKLGVIHTKEIKKEVFLTSINRSHELLKNIEEIQENQEINEVKTNKTLQITPIYKPNSQSSVIRLLHEGDEKLLEKEFISIQDINELIKKYTTKKNITNPKNRRLVTLDELLSSIVLKKNEIMKVKVLKKDEIVERLTQNMKEFSLLSLPNKEPIIKKGKIEPMNFTIEMKQGNKKVTVITGFEKYEIDCDEVMGYLKTQCACGVSSTELPNNVNPPLRKITVQCTKMPMIIKVFKDKFSIPCQERNEGKKGMVLRSPYITVIDKSQKKKK